MIFPDFWFIKPIAWSIEIVIKILVWICLARLVFNRCSIDRNWKFSVFKYLTNLFFHASFVFRIHMHCIVFRIHLAVFAVISVIVFTHNMHTLCYIGYSTWFKNWLINFWVLYCLVFALFICELQKIFFLRDTMDNQCANIFSTHATVYGSHNVKFAFIERENFFFFMCILNLVFEFGLCLFIFPHLLYFPQNLFCFFPLFL